MDSIINHLVELDETPFVETWLAPRQYLAKLRRVREEYAVLPIHWNENPYLARFESWCNMSEFMPVGYWLLTGALALIYSAPNSPIRGFLLGLGLGCFCISDQNRHFMTRAVIIDCYLMRERIKE